MLEDLPDFTKQDLPAESQPALLKISVDPPDVADHFNTEALNQFHAVCQDRDRSPVFLVIEESASANDIYQQLDVSDKSAVQALLKKEPENWKKYGGRIAYIGAVLRSESQIKIMRQMLAPLIEPVLSLLLRVEWDTGTPLDMVVQLFLCNKRNPEVLSLLLFNQWLLCCHVYSIHS